MFIILAFPGNVKKPIVTIVSTYGKVPLFYFLVHFFLIHFILLAVLLLQGFHGSQLDFASGTFGRPKELSSGLPLWAVYLLWMGVVVGLYKPVVRKLQRTVVKIPVKKFDRVLSEWNLNTPTK